MKNKLMILSVMLMTHAFQYAQDLRQKMLADQAAMVAKREAAMAEKRKEKMMADDRNAQKANTTMPEKVTKSVSSSGYSESNYLENFRKKWKETAQEREEEVLHDANTVTVVTDAIQKSIFPKIKSGTTNEIVYDSSSSKAGIVQVGSTDTRDIKQLDGLQNLPRTVVPLLTPDELRAQEKAQNDALEDALEIERLRKQWRVVAIQCPIPMEDIKINPDAKPLSEQTKFEVFREYIAQHPYQTGAVVVVIGGLVTAGIVAYKKGYFEKFKFKNPFAKAKKQPKKNKRNP